MLISVIIPTFNRGALVTSLARWLVTNPPTRCSQEVIVVNDGSTDGTGALVGSVEEVRLVTTSGVGLVRARKIGLAASRGDILVFLDDDAVPQSGFVDRVVPALLRGESLVQSKIIFHENEESELQDDSSVQVLIPWTMRGVFRVAGAVRERPIAFGHEFGLFVRRDVLRAVPFGDTNLIGDGFGESMSFSLRCLQHGLRIWLVPTSVIHHVPAALGGSRERVLKAPPSKNCTQFATILTHNCLYLMYRFGPRYRVPLGMLYFGAAGVLLSIRQRRKCFRFFFNGVRLFLSTTYRPIELEV